MSPTVVTNFFLASVLRMQVTVKCSPDPENNNLVLVRPLSKKLRSIFDFFGQQKLTLKEILEYCSGAALGSSRRT